MSVTKRGDKWLVRWREDGRQLTRTYNTRREAVEHEVELRLARDPNLPGPGRPEIGPAVQIRLERDLIAWADEQAAARGQSRAAFLRDALDYARALEFPYGEAQS